jgi:hypothetical protein
VSHGYDNDQTNESLVKLWWDNFGRGMKQHSMQCACSTCSKNLTSMYWIVFYFLNIVEIKLFQLFQYGIINIII